jgi:hypothetical protein
MDSKLHIVAPEAKRDKVFQEIRRLAFSLLEKGPVAEAARTCPMIAFANSLIKSTSLIRLDEYTEQGGEEAFKLRKEKYGF